jgi:hypothetical protein
VIRRLLPVLVPLVAAAALTSCSSLSNSGAASVNGAVLDRSDLELFTKEVFAVDTEFVQTELTNQVATNWIVDELIAQYLEEQGVTVDEAARADAEAQVDSEVTGRGLEISAATREFLVHSAAVRATFDATQGGGSLFEFAEAADIQVDSRYGRWVLDAGAVLPLG